MIHAASAAGLSLAGCVGSATDAVQRFALVVGANYGGLKTGDKVYYDNGGGTSIGGLDSSILTNYSVVTQEGGKIKLRAVDSSGNVGIGTTTPTAFMHLGNGTATTAHMNWDAATLLTAANTGVIV